MSQKAKQRLESQFQWELARLDRQRLALATQLVSALGQKRRLWTCLLEPVPNVRLASARGIWLLMR